MFLLIMKGFLLFLRNFHGSTYLSKLCWCHQLIWRNFYCEGLVEYRKITACHKVTAHAFKGFVITHASTGKYAAEQDKHDLWKLFVWCLQLQIDILMVVAGTDIFWGLALFHYMWWSFTGKF